MADITMCAGAQYLPVGKDGEMVAIECFRRKNCHRYTAKENPFRQSYFMDIPVHVAYNDNGEQTQQCDEMMIDFEALLGGK